MQARCTILGLSLALAAGLLAGACGSSATSEPTADTTEPVESATTSSPASSVSPPTTTTVAEIDPTAPFVDFATAWDGANWETLGTLATANVVDVAMQWYEDGGNATAGVLNALDNGCLDVFETGRSCEFVYAPPEGQGLVFVVTFADGDTGPVVTDLLFGGDAG